MASSRQESASIDSRNAAVMQLESEHRRLRHTLARIMEGWNTIDPDERVPESLNALVGDRAPNENILNALGLRREVVYVVKFVVAKP